MSRASCSGDRREPVPVEFRQDSPDDLDTASDVGPLMLKARQAREAFMAQRQKRRNASTAWGALLILAISPLIVIPAFPDRVVAAAPASIAWYESLGWEVNIYGLIISKPKIEQRFVDGRPEIIITGDVTNVSETARKLPRLRFGIRDITDTELHAWQLNNGDQPLRPGETRHFVSRLAAPPETARKVEIRFARTAEISSNTLP